MDFLVLKMEPGTEKTLGDMEKNMGGRILLFLFPKTHSERVTVELTFLAAETRYTLGR